MLPPPPKKKEFLSELKYQKLTKDDFIMEKKMYNPTSTVPEELIQKYTAISSTENTQNPKVIYEIFIGGASMAFFIFKWIF